MKTATRIYLVVPKALGADLHPAVSRLVEATHPANALRHVAADQLTVAVASQAALVELPTAGVKVERIKSEQQELPT